MHEINDKTFRHPPPPPNNLHSRPLSAPCPDCIDKVSPKLKKVSHGIHNSSQQN